MRCFVAVDLDPKLRPKIEALQKELVGMDTKLVEPHNLHFTMKFLGEAGEGIVNKVKTMLKDVAKATSPFITNIKGAGVFPHEKFIRVVWLGAEKQADVEGVTHSLTNLQAATNHALADLFKKEKPEQNDAKRQSTVHLTVARVRSQKHRDEIIGFVNRHKNIEIGTMKVEEIKLKKSTVTSKGPIYEDVAVFKLGE